MGSGVVIPTVCQSRELTKKLNCSSWRRFSPKCSDAIFVENKSKNFAILQQLAAGKILRSTFPREKSSSYGEVQLAGPELVD